jgi:hypothetical protein
MYRLELRLTDIPVQGGLLSGFVQGIGAGSALASLARRTGPISRWHLPLGPGTVRDLHDWRLELGGVQAKELPSQYWRPIALRTMMTTPSRTNQSHSP